MSSIAVVKATMRYAEGGGAAGRQCPDCGSHALTSGGRRCAKGGFWVRLTSSCNEFHAALPAPAVMPAAGSAAATESPNQACRPSAA